MKDFVIHVVYFNMECYVLIGKNWHAKKEIFLDALTKNLLKQLYPIVLSAMMEYSLSLLFSMVATSHFQLLST